MICPRCLEEKDISEFLLKTGRKRVYCSPCMREYKRNRYAANPEPARMAAKKRYTEKREEIAAYQKIYSEEHKEEKRLREAGRRIEKKEEIKEKDRIRNQNPARKEMRRARHSYRYNSDQEYRERVRKSSKRAQQKYYHDNKDEILLKSKDKYWSDPKKARERSRDSVRRWSKIHPDKARNNNLRRRARLKAASIEQFDESLYKRYLSEWQLGRCYLCNGFLSEAKGTHLEHHYALDNGGVHARRNLSLACDSCNSSKRIKVYGIEWMPKHFNAAEDWFVFSDEIKDAFDGDMPFYVVSTFLASERNAKNPKSLISDLRNTYGKPIFFDFEWREKKEIILSMMKHRRGNSQSIGGRETDLVVLDTDDAAPFFDATHIQGFGRGSFYYGLVKNNELVAASAWLEFKDRIELNRLSFVGHVSGGFSKLLKHVSRVSNKPIISFVDQRYADGNSYEKIGFRYIGETANPVYYYVNGSGIYHRRLFTKEKQKSMLEYFNEDLTEAKNANANGFFRLYGMKQKKYIFIS